MDDRQLEQLVRMAFEAEGLERAGAAAAESPEESTRLRLVGVGRAGGRGMGVSRGMWMIGGGLAAAACAAAAFIVLSPEGPSSGGGGGAIADNTADGTDSGAVVKGADEEDGTKARLVDVAAGGSSSGATPNVPKPEAGGVGGADETIVLAIFTDAKNVKHCVQWREDPFGVNRKLADVATAELLGVPFDFSCGRGAASDLLVVGIEGPSGAMPNSAARFEELATCILGTTDTCGDPASSYETAARTCVGPGVTVKVETLAMK